LHIGARLDISDIVETSETLQGGAYFWATAINSDTEIGVEISIEIAMAAPQMPPATAS
jgi:hypothetical protein